MVKKVLAVVALTVFSLVAATAMAGPTPGQKCAASKKQTAGKKAKCKEGCDSKAIKAALPFSNQAVVDCNGKCTAKFSAKWDKVEAKGGCVTTGDKIAIEGKVDMLQSDLRATLGAGGPSKCTASVYKEAGKKAACKLKCHAKAQKKGLPPNDPDLLACLNKCTAKFSDPVKGKCPKAVAANDCINAVNCPAVENRVDLFVDDTVAELPTTAIPTTTSTSSTTSTSTTVPCGNGVRDNGEQCDGMDLGGATCSSGGGSFTCPACKVDCTLDCSCCVGATCATTTSTSTSSTTSTTLLCEPIVPGQPIANTYQLLGVAGPKLCITTSAANAFGPCNSDADCGNTSGGCLQTPWVTADGFAFQFPSGITTTFTIAAEDPVTCSHTACIKCGNPAAACAGIPGCGTPPGAPQNGCSKNTCCDTPGFNVPTFNVPILGGLCGRVDQFACGAGVVNSSDPQAGDNEVSKSGDTSDPGADCTYGTVDDCPSPTCKACTATGQGADTKGKVVRTVGNGSADTNGIHFRISTPELATVWQDTMNPCPDGSTFDSGEGLISQLVLNAEPTSAGATGSFVDLNGDGCKHAGAGFTTTAPDGPITVAAAPSGPAQPQSYDGTVGSIQVAVGPIFSGAAPLNDIGFVAITPNAPASLQPADTCTCTPVPGCPE